MTAEPCALLYRASTVGQVTENQVPEVTAYTANKGYVVARTIKIKKSGSSGIHAADLAGVLEDMRNGLYRVLVVAHSSRLDRRNEAEQTRFELALYDAGGRVESARENGKILPNFDSGTGKRVMGTVTADGNAEYSRSLKENVGAGMRNTMANGAFAGPIPWGMMTRGPKQNKKMIAGPLAAEWAEPVYQRVKRGDSLGEVCRWLTAQGVPSGPAGHEKVRPWWPRSVGQMIRHRAYTGVYDVHYTVTWYTFDDAGDRIQHRETLRWVHRGEMVVPPTLWRSANDMLSSRRDDRRGPRSPVKAELEPLSGASRCAACAERGVTSPMYKIRPLDGEFRLRCAGKGAGRKGCGNMVVLSDARAAADELLGGSEEDMREVVTTRGNAAEKAVAKDAIERERQAVAMRGLSWEDEEVVRARLRAEWDRVDQQPDIPDRREAHVVLAPDGSPDTWGKAWQRKDARARRDWLKTGVVTVYLGKPGATLEGDEPGAVRGTAAVWAKYDHAGDEE